jgi:hypothetical protein
LICIFFAEMCALHVSFRSRVKPRYLTSFTVGNGVSLKVTVTAGQSTCRLVNVICADFSSLILIDLIFLATHGSGVDATSNRRHYKDNSLG